MGLISAFRTDLEALNNALDKDRAHVSGLSRGLTYDVDSKTRPNALIQVNALSGFKKIVDRGIFDEDLQEEQEEV